MRLKTLLTGSLCLALLVGCFAGSMALPVNAQEKSQGIAVIPYRTPVITANVGDTVDLTQYGVEFEEGVATTQGLTWTGDAIQQMKVTPAKAGLTALKVKNAAGVSKNVYVVAKNPTDTEYVLFENNFDTDAEGLTVVEGKATMTVADGRLTLYASATENMIRLPEFLGDFGDYRLEMKAYTVTRYSTSGFYGVFARAPQSENAHNTYFVRMRYSATAWDAAGYYFRTETGYKRFSWCAKHDGLNAGAANDYLHVFTMVDDLLTYEVDGNYIFHAEEPKAQRTGHLGLGMTKAKLSIDYIRVTLPENTPNAPISAAFTPDANLPKGTIAGKLQVALDENGTQPLDVAYYWGTGEGKLANYAPFAKIRVKDSKNVEATIPAGTVVPAGVTQLLVYTENASGESAGYISIPLPAAVVNMAEETPIVSFQVASDMHLGATESQVYETDKKQFIEFLQGVQTKDPDSIGMFLGGDIADKGVDTEFAKFKNVVAEYGNGLNIEGVIGNHEFWGSEDYAWIMNTFFDAMGITEATPETPYYHKTISGYDFIFLNTIKKQSTGSSHNKSTLGTAQLEWLENLLEEKAKHNKPLFIFHHQKFNEIVEATDLKAILAKYPQAIFVTSHSHEDPNQEGGLFSFATDSMCNTFNTSALSFILDYHYNSNSERPGYTAIGFYVEVYTDKVIVKGLDVATDEWMPSSQFVFAYDDPQSCPEGTAHEFNDWMQIKAPTAAEAGEEYRECKNFNHYEIREIPKPIKTGWNLVDGKWYYVGEDGEYVVNKWMKDSKGWVKLGADGAMLTNKWTTDSKGWCFVGADGYAVTNCWKKDSKGWIYLNAEGSMTKAKWVKTDGKWYYCDANGYMVTNKWQKDSKGWVKLGADGAMLTNKWTTDSKGWCYVGANGYAVTNTWKKDNTGWIYLDKEGSMTKSKWVNDGGKWYYCDGNGYMVAGKSMKIGNKTYKFNASGVCTNP